MKLLNVIIISLIFATVSCIFDILISKYIQKVRDKHENNK